MTRKEQEKAIRVLDDMKVKIDIPKAAVMQNDKNWATVFPGFTYREQIKKSSKEE